MHLFGSKQNRGAAKLVVDKNGGRLFMFSNEKVKVATHISASMGTSEDGTGSGLEFDHKNGGGVFMSATEQTVDRLCRQLGRTL